MEIKRCTKSFRSASRGANAGSLYPASHALVKEFPGFFEPVEDYVSRMFPEHAPKPADAHTEAPKPAAKKTAARRPAPKK